MSLVFIISILLKGVGAIIEVLLQVVITRKIGVSEFGTYSAFVNVADLIYWCLFSGLVKCNTFYLAESGTTIREFKRRYYGFYVIPVTLAGVLFSALTHKYVVCCVFAIALAELWVMDNSSSFMARRYSVRALFGEYVLGRFLLLLGVIALASLSIVDTTLLVFLYLLQFILIGLFFGIQKRWMPKNNQKRSVSLGKWGNYQRADIIQSMIAQMPVIIPFLFVGSFEAGVVSVVMLVKKLVNFISGPSFKVFLPEFSRLYKKHDLDGIRTSYASIMRMQMLFLGPLAVILLGYPGLLLRVMADELLEYTGLFMLCSAIFIIVASIGPCSGLMQMTGNEHWDNRFREIALAMMFLVFAIMRKDPFFVLYGLCTQAVLENIGKFLFVSRWMNGMPVKLLMYLRWWLIPGIMIAAARILKLQESFIAMLSMAMIVFLVDLVIEIRYQNLLGILISRNKN